MAAKPTQKLGSVAIGSTAQGVPIQKLSRNEAIQWFTDEISFWQRNTNLSGDAIADKTNFGTVDIATPYINRLERVINDLKSGGEGQASQFFQDADTLRLIVGQGYVGSHLVDLAKEYGPDAARLPAMAFSSAVIQVPSQQLNGPLARIRASVVLNPWIASTSDVVSSKSALAAATASLSEASEARAKLDDFIVEQKERMLANEETFNNKLMLMAPSKHWAGVAQQAAIAAYVSLAAFAILLAIPTALIAWNWASVSSYVKELTVPTPNTISLSSVVIVSIPVLAYGWLLRHVSRIFVQNLNLSSDAAHRRVMAATFLGLSRIKATAITEQDRALVLNALFRPAPPHPAEEGPPAGLVDLIRKQ